MIQRLGAEVVAYDPIANESIHEGFPDIE
ncbi:hypothetical protein [Halorubrum miltondacostae]